MDFVEKNWIFFWGDYRDKNEIKERYMVVIKEVIRM